ncbi:hypothetical protein J0910_00015 [Nocardiopsis sp. CNT-189]|uniref:hypothetical protein n=1 Tax=Nocardiopsis oceanisediminis TaxID=2816862 RepID=UPI003B383ACC
MKIPEVEAAMADLPEAVAGATGPRRWRRCATSWRAAAPMPATGAASLATQLRLVLADLDALSAGEEADIVDDLAKRRAARRSGAADQGGAAGAE